MNFDWSQFTDKWAAWTVAAGALVALLGGFTNFPVRFGGSEDELGNRDDGIPLSRRAAVLVGSAMVLVGLAVFLVRLGD